MLYVCMYVFIHVCMCVYIQMSTPEGFGTPRYNYQGLEIFAELRELPDQLRNFRTMGLDVGLPMQLAVTILK